MVSESRHHVHQVDHKVRKNMDHIFDENLEMMSTIKQYSREDRHMSNLTDAKNNVMKNLENVVFWRNIEEFISGLKNTLSFCIVLYILLNNNSEISGPQIVTVFLLYNDVQGIFDRFKHHSNMFIEQFPYIEKY